MLELLLQKFVKAAESFYDEINVSLKQKDRFYQVEIDNLKSKITSLENKHEARLNENTEAAKVYEAERYRDKKKMDIKM